MGSKETAGRIIDKHDPETKNSVQNTCPIVSSKNESVSENDNSTNLFEEHIHTVNKNDC